MLVKNSALETLLEGNNRYIEGKSIHPNQGQEVRDANLKKQTPYAIVLTCSDSRVPAEIIFDAGIGEIFVVRSAGHVLSPDVLGSIEYAIKSLGVGLILIMGHTNCGAVNTALSTYKNDEFNNLSANLKSIMEHIHDAFDTTPDLKEKNNHEIIKAHVEYQLKDFLRKDEQTAELIKQNKVTLKGAIYDILSGKVEVIDDPA